jgi:hypothetical protein
MNRISGLEVHLRFCEFRDQEPAAHFSAELQLGFAEDLNGVSS